MANRLTTTQVCAIAEEINEWHQHSDDWRIQSIDHFYMLTEECYLVRYIDGFSHVFARDKITGTLMPASGYTYHAPLFTGFDETPESEAQA